MLTPSSVSARGPLGWRGLSRDSAGGSGEPLSVAEWVGWALPLPPGGAVCGCCLEASPQQNRGHAVTPEGLGAAE